MTTLDLVRRGWFRTKYEVRRDGALISYIDEWRWRERRTVLFDGNEYSLQITGWLNNHFSLYAGEAEIAHARKTKWFSRSFFVEHQERSYLLKPESWLSGAFLLLGEHNRTAGSIVPEGIMGRTSRVTFEDDVPPAVQFFAIWLVLEQWSEDAVCA